MAPVCQLVNVMPLCKTLRSTLSIVRFTVMVLSQPLLFGITSVYVPEVVQFFVPLGPLYTLQAVIVIVPVLLWFTVKVIVKMLSHPKAEVTVST